MDSKTLVNIHLVAVNLFVLIYLVKTILLFTSTARLDSFARKIKVPEMIVSTVFLGTGIWLYAILGAIKVMQLVKLGLIACSIPLAVSGFKKHHRGLALLSMLLIVAAYGLAEASRNKPYIPANVQITGNASPAEAEGARGYLANCAMCHGERGDKQYRGAALLTTTKMDAGAAAMIVTSGIRKGTRGSMPAFGGTLSKEEIDFIAAYIQGLKNKNL